MDHHANSIIGIARILFSLSHFLSLSLFRSISVIKAVLKSSQFAE